MHSPRDYFAIKRGKVRLKSKRQHGYLHAHKLDHSHYEYRAGKYVYKRERLGFSTPGRRSMARSFRRIEARE